MQMMWPIRCAQMSLDKQVVTLKEPQGLVWWVLFTAGSEDGGPAVGKWREEDMKVEGCSSWKI